MEQLRQERRDLEKRIRQLRRDQQTKPRFVPAQDFASEVAVRNGQQEFFGVPNLIECLMCKRKFETSWSLTQHTQYCRVPDATHIRPKREGKYPCNVCSHISDTLPQIKRHFFYCHSDAELAATYNRDFESLMSKYWLDRCRKRVFSGIMHSKFDLFLGYMMNPDKPVDVSSIKYIYPLTLDHEKENQKL